MMKFNLRNMRIHGFSLVEILVALFIGSLLVLGALQIYLNVFRGGKSNTKNAVMQEQGRLISEVIARHARRAGYMGCVSSNTEISFKGNEDKNITYPYDALRYVERNDMYGIQFRYAQRDSSNKKSEYPYKDCEGVKLNEYLITFLWDKDTDKRGIYVISPETGVNRMELLAPDIEVADIKFIEKPCVIKDAAGNEITKDMCYHTITPQDINTFFNGDNDPAFDKQAAIDSSVIHKVNQLDLELLVVDSENKIATKTFVVSVNLRNRILNK